MGLAIREFEAGGDWSEKAVDAFIESQDFPIVEGNAITFVFRGKVDKVILRHWVFGLESSPPLERMGETDLWYMVIDLPPHSRIEYKFDIVIQGKHRWVHDPFNPQIARDPFGFNSVCHTKGYETPAWIHPDPEAKPGTLEEHQLTRTVFGDDRTIGVYLPARFCPTTRRYPLLLVHDGMDYIRYACLQTILDNLIHRLEIPPMIVGLLQARDRLEEYAAHPHHARFIMEDVLPMLERRYPLFQSPSQRGLMGASFGGVAALSTAWRNQGGFGRMLLQSGSFAFTDIGHHRRGPAFDPVVKFMNNFRERPGLPAQKLYITCGTYESLIYENRSLIPLLQASGMVVKYVEARDGHNWENWRDRLREGLSWLFPGPLWMVYE